MAACDLAHAGRRASAKPQAAGWSAVMGWFASIFSWSRARSPRRADLHVILYTRARCPLCDEAAELLERLRKRHGFMLEARDVDASSDLVAAYGNWVPVVTINGKLRFRGHVNPILLQRILDAPAYREDSAEARMTDGKERS